MGLVFSRNHFEGINLLFIQNHIKIFGQYFHPRTSAENKGVRLGLGFLSHCRMHSPETWEQPAPEGRAAGQRPMVEMVAQAKPAALVKKACLGHACSEHRKATPSSSPPCLLLRPRPWALEPGVSRVPVTDLPAAPNVLSTARPVWAPSCPFCLLRGPQTCAFLPAPPDHPNPGPVFCPGPLRGHPMSSPALFWSILRAAVGLKAASNHSAAVHPPTPPPPISHLLTVLTAQSELAPGGGKAPRGLSVHHPPLLPPLIRPALPPHSGHTSFLQGLRLPAAPAPGPWHMLPSSTLPAQVSFLQGMLL